MITFDGLTRRILFRALIVLIVPTIVVLRSRTEHWVGEWAWTIDWVNGGAILSGPLVAGLTAYEVSRTSGPQWIGLARQTPRPSAQMLRSAALVVVAGLIWWVLGMMFALTQSWARGAAGDIPWWPLVYVPVQLAASGAVGLWLGSRIPKLGSAPLAILTVFILTYLGGTGAIPNLFRNGASTGSLVGQTWDMRVGMTVNLVLMAVALGLVTLAMSQHAIMRRGRLWVAGMTMLAVSSVGITSLAIYGDERIVPTGGAPTYACDGKIVQTCMALETSSGLRNLSPIVDGYAQILRAANAKLPARFTQEIPGVPGDPDAGVMVIPPELTNRPERDIYGAADYVVIPHPCPGLSALRVPQEALDAMAVLSRWLRVRAELPGAVPPPGDPMYTWLQAPRAEQEEWVRTSYEQLSTCALESLEIPFTR